MIVQLSTAWVHIVITRRSTTTHFWQRLPPFRRTFDATGPPTVIYWLAIQISNTVPIVLAHVLGIRLKDHGADGETSVPAPGANDAWKAVVIAVATLAVSLFLIIPAQAVLVRVQASLLPESEDAILAFDRSFGGAVTPTIVGGKGYATVADAWRSFTASAWRRYLGLSVKIFFVNIATMLGIGLVVGLEFLAISAFA